MRYTSLHAFLGKGAHTLDARGPFALVLLEDGEAIDATIAHCKSQGFREVLVFGAAELLPETDTGLHLIEHNMHLTGALTTVVNALIQRFPSVWLHYCYNAEFLFFPFCESRNIREMLAFHTEERRDAVLTYVIDLYSTDLGSHPTGVTLGAAHFDREGHYALQRTDAQGKSLDRQLDFFGGLRWRYEQHIPPNRRRIDRIGLFKAAKGLELLEDHTFNDPEYNTYTCPWHNNITAAICSFRTAKALLSNPHSMHDVRHFWWKHSEPFKWNSAQLMELGFIEPGQWF
ncbi:MAG: hypothetical protein ABJ327_00275 [Litoreibacter sp.]